MFEMITEPTFVEFAKLIAAVLLGALLGTERMIAGKGVGIRTFALVSLGSCLMIVMSNHVSLAFLGFVDFDPLRVAAAIVGGIGFLGAGVIIFREHMLQGLTTAAGLWVAAAVGMTVGFGLYALALFTTLLTIFVFTVMWFIEERVRGYVHRYLPEHPDQNHH